MVFAPGIEFFRPPQRGSADLGGLREVGVSVHEVVQRLPVDPESLGGLFGGQVMGQIHGPTITDQSSSTTGMLRVGQLLDRGCVVQFRYNFRLYPTPGQKQALARTFGCARVVYNDALRARKDAREAGQPFPK